MHSFPASSFVIAPAALFFALSIVPRYAIPAEDPSTNPPSSTSADGFSTFDRRYDQLGKAVATASATRPVRPDSRDRVISDDVKAWVLTPDTRDRIANLRGGAEAAISDGNLSGAQQMLVEASWTVRDENARLSAIVTYWRMRAVLDELRLLWQIQLNVAPIESRAVSQQRIDALESNLIQAVGPEESHASLWPVLDALVKAYNAERGDLAARTTNRRVVDNQLEWIAGTTDCTTIQERHVAKSLPNLYSDSARRAYLEGVVRVRAKVDSNGCLIAKAVESSSGSVILDDLALKASDMLVYKAPNSTSSPCGCWVTTFPVTFELHSETIAALESSGNL